MSEIPEDRKDEYIDHLHDRIQFLEQELRKSEQTVLELRQEQRDARPDVEKILETREIDLEEAADLSPVDFQGFEDEMLHTPEEILEDTEKAVEELMHAAELLKQEEEKLDALKEVNHRIRENNRDWFGED
jgi:hypothetical protein